MRDEGLGFRVWDSGSGYRGARSGSVERILEHHTAGVGHWATWRRQQPRKYVNETPKHYT